MSRSDKTITDLQKHEALAQMTEMQDKIDVDISLSLVSSIVEDFQNNILCLPKSISSLVWSKKQQMKLIEMVLMGLPIPSIIVWSISENPYEYPFEEKYEIVDGSQRVLTLDAFMNDRLKLENLEILSLLNGFRFSDIHFIQRNKFKARMLKTVVIENTVSRNLAQEIATRIDSGGTPLQYE